MHAEERIIRGHFGFDDDRRVVLSIENPIELRMVISHRDGSAYIELDLREVRELRDALNEWLERGHQTPLSAGRHR
jgi:hypothetical protein